MQHLNIPHLSELLARHRLRYHHIVAFRPTGWTFSNKRTVSVQRDPSGNIHLYGVPYRWVACWCSFA